MSKSRKVKQTKNRSRRRTSRRRTSRRKMTGGTRPVTHTNIQQKIGYAKKARKEGTKNADKFEEDIDEEWSLGDFVISGGEIAAMAFIDAMVRLIPGALHDERSSIQDSFVNGILDHPHYTRPAKFNGHLVPEVLLSGSHQAIERWRRTQALGKTWLKRPDLLEHLVLSPEDKQLLAEFKQNIWLATEASTSFKE